MRRGFLLPLVLAILAAIVYAMIVSRAEKKLNDSKTEKLSLVESRAIQWNLF